MKLHNVEALILKGRVLYDLKKYQDAVLHFREAQQVYSLLTKVIDQK